MIFKFVLYLSTDSQYQVLRQARSYEDADDSSAGIPMYEEHRYIRSLHQGILDRQKFHHCLMCDMVECIIKKFLVAVHQRIQFFRHCEHGMKIEHQARFFSCCLSIHSSTSIPWHIGQWRFLHEL